jgi:hypothetical protein
MNEAELIAKAIEGLHTNIFKDYFVPALTVLTSALFSIWIARYTVDKQETTKIEIQKIQSINSILLMLSNVREGLIAIRLNYFDRINDDPVDRVRAVPPLILTKADTNFDIATLSFLAPNKQESQLKYSNLAKTAALLSNYTVLEKLIF